jgi:hypothetical protein
MGIIMLGFAIAQPRRQFPFSGTFSKKISTLDEVRRQLYELFNVETRKDEYY